MPGDYESFSAAGPRNRPFGGEPPQPMVPPSRTPFPQLPPNTSSQRYPGRTPLPRIPPPPPGPVRGMSPRRGPMVPGGRPVVRRRQRHRRRPLTPEIVVSRRHHSRGRRVFTVPLDRRPTLGLRGPCKRVVEIERVPCRRRRRHRSVCYEYDNPPPVVQQPTLIANPVANPSLGAIAQPSMLAPINTVPTVAATTAAALSNLTADRINNLPRQTVHLPPIHMPGSHADANTELETVVFPAEIINPIDGTLSIIQANPGAQQMIAHNIQPVAFAPAAAQSPLIQIPAHIGTPVRPRVPLGSPAMGNEALMQRFQSLFQRMNIPRTQPPSRIPDPPVIRPTLPGSTLNTSPMAPSTSATSIGGYPRANIQPANALNIGTYRPPNTIPTVPQNITPYRPASITSSFSPSNPPYRPSSFTPSAPTNNLTYRPLSGISSTGSDVGPYQRANITPYTNLNPRPPLNSLPTQSTAPSGPTPYNSTPLTPSAPRTPFPRLYPTSSSADDNALTPNSTMNSMPKSILRNPSTPFPSITN